MKTPRWIILALSLLTIHPQFASQVHGSVALNEMPKGTQVLQFGIGSSLTLDDFKGSALSYQWFLKDRLGLRIFIDYENWDYEKQYSEVDHYNEYLIGVDRNDDLREWNRHFSGGFQVVWFLRKTPVDLFLGLGPIYTHTYTREDESNFSWSDYEFIESREALEIKTESIGVASAVGIQVPLGSRMAIHVEYSASLTTSSQDIVRQYWREGNLESSHLEGVSMDTWRLTSSGGKMGLSVFF